MKLIVACCLPILCVSCAPYCDVMQVSVQHFRNVGLPVSSVVNRALQCSHVTDTGRRMAADTSFLGSALDKGERSASRAGRLTIGERTPSIY